MAPRFTTPATAPDPTEIAGAASAAEQAAQPPDAAAQTPALQDVPQQVALVNGSFEEPAISGKHQMLPDASVGGARSVQGWRTTASDHVIELWHDRSGVPAADGMQFAELNANESSALYQDLETTPGSTLYWSLHHRGRSGEDTMSVKIGSPDRKPNKTWNLTDGAAAWRQHTGEYKVPRGQKITRFAFEAGATAGGDPTVGNFLDNIVFGTAPCLVVTKTAEPQSGAAVGDIITYTVNLANHGGVPAENLVLHDTVPAGTSYVPGSMKVTDGPGPSSGGTGWYDSKTRRLTLPLGHGASAAQGGTLPCTANLPDGITAQFQVRLEPDGADRTLTGRASATYDNTRASDTDKHLSSTSNTAMATTAPAAAAELTVSITADRTNAAIGENATFHLVVSNVGRTDASGVTVALPLPEGLQVLSATGAGPHDPETGHWDIGDVPAGGAVDLYLRATATASGALPVTATISRGGDPEQAPVASASAAVAVCAHPAAGSGGASALPTAGPGGAAAYEQGAAGDAVHMVSTQAAQRHPGIALCLPSHLVHLGPSIVSCGCAASVVDRVDHDRPVYTGYGVAAPITGINTLRLAWVGKRGSKKRSRHHKQVLHELALQIHALNRQLAELQGRR